jgi:C4-dicarboxylate transporter
MMRRRAGRFLLRIPGIRSEATVLGGSGFMGVALGSVLPAGGLAPFVAGLPSVTVPLLIPLLLIATGQLGLNPVAVVAVIGAAVPDPAALGVPPAVLAFACMLGWGLGVSMTPMSSSAIITARWAGVSPWTVTTRWNAAYTSSALIVAWTAIVVAFALWPR